MASEGSRGVPGEGAKIDLRPKLTYYSEFITSSEQRRRGGGAGRGEEREGGRGAEKRKNLSEKELKGKEIKLSKIYRKKIS